MYRIDDNLKEFVESGVAVVVGTGNEARRPHIAYGWAPRVHEDRTTLDVFLDAARAEKTLTNLRANGRIAVTFADPVSYRSVQLKGVFRNVGAPEGPDRDWVQQGREAFAVATSLIGDDPTVSRNRWLEDVVRVEFVVERAFDQTPGPGAGKPL
jgi:hypothetical protein